MTSISAFSMFSSYGIEAANKKMTAEEIARWKRVQTGEANTTDKFALPASQGVDLSNIKKLDTAIANLRKLTDEEVAKFQKIREQIYTRISNLDELKDHVSQKVYAEVKVGGETIATIYNGGTSMTSNAMGGKIRHIIEKLDSKLSGPEYAQELADAIAEELDGEVVLASTAVSQAEYMSTPPFEPEFEIDYAAMERDLQTALGRLAVPQTQVDTQTLAQQLEDLLTEADELPAAGESAVDEFMKYQNMTWEEKVADMILRSMGLTKEDLAKMEPGERDKILAKIKEKIEEEVEKKTGMAPSATAVAATDTGSVA